MNPLVPEGAWDWFCLDRVRYHGRLLTVLWDRDGTKYGRGTGLQVFADGQRIARADRWNVCSPRFPGHWPPVSGPPRKPGPGTNNSRGSSLQLPSLHRRQRRRHVAGGHVDPPTIDRELGWAASLGFNRPRVPELRGMEADAAGLKSRLARFLEIAHRHGIVVMPILFDDCNFAGRVAAAGPQPDPDPRRAQQPMGLEPAAQNGGRPGRLAAAQTLRPGHGGDVRP